MLPTGNVVTDSRLAFLKDELDRASSVRIVDMAQALGVSEMTVRRDLVELEAMGLARRVRGGAMAVGPVALVDRLKHKAAEKSAIATKLLGLVPASGAIAVDASSTALRLATAMGGARDLTVITNGPDAFLALQDKPGIRACSTGGFLDSRTGSLVGPIACRSSTQYMASRFFTSAAALDPVLGTSEACVEEAEVKRALHSVSSEVVLAVDSTKLNQRSVAACLEWSSILTLVTELDPENPKLDAYRELVDLL